MSSLADKSAAAFEMMLAKRGELLEEMGVNVESARLIYLQGWIDGAKDFPESVIETILESQS